MDCSGCLKASSMLCGGHCPHTAHRTCFSRQVRTKCFTVSRASLYSHAGDSRALISASSSPSPIFPVRTWISIDETARGSPRYRSSMDGWRSGWMRYSCLPCVCSSRHASCHLVCRSALYCLVMAARTVTLSVVRRSGFVMNRAYGPRGPCSRHPVASFACLSTVSLPGMSRWDGIQCMCTWTPSTAAVLISWWMRRR